MSKFVPVLLRGYNNYDTAKASDEVGFVPIGCSLTQQHFREECDINVIVERFGLLGELPSGVRAPMYGDFTGVSDYQSALAQIMAADESFMQLRPEVRARFQNDAGLFVDFCSNPANIEAMREMGLAVEKRDESGGRRVDGIVGSAGGGKVVASGGGSGGDAASVGGSDGGARSGAAGGAASGGRER